MNEVLGLPTDNSGLVKRFGHTYISGDSSIFDAAQGVGSISQDGRFYMFASDMMGTLGSTASTPANTCQPGGLDWQATTAYSTITSSACTASSISGVSPSCIHPDTGNAGGFIFAATTGGTTAGSHPTWPTGLNSTVSDGTVTWTNIGKATCRGDVFVMELR
jgi:hypothetical protein